MAVFKIKKLLLLVLSDKGIKFIGEFLLNLLILRKFGLVDYGVFTTSLAYTTVLASIVFVGSREIQLIYFQNIKKDRSELFSEVFLVRIIIYFFGLIMFTGYLYLFQNSILRYFIPMSINALLVLNIIIENQSSIYQELEKFKKNQVTITLMFLIFQIFVLIFGEFNLTTYVWVYFLKFICTFTFLFLNSNLVKIKFVLPIRFFKFILNRKHYIFFQVLIVIFIRMGIFLSNYYLDKNTVGSLSLSFNIYIIVSQIILAFVIVEEEKNFSFKNRLYSNSDKIFVKNMYSFSILITLAFLIFFNLLYLFPIFKQFVYLRISLNLLIFTIPLLTYLSVKKIFLIKSNTDIESKFYNIRLLFCVIFFIIISAVTSNYIKLYFIELSFVTSFILFLLLTKSRHTFKASDILGFLYLKNLKNSLIYLISKHD